MMKATRAFTLVELLIVVAILGILAAIAVPKFSDASNEARTSATRAGLATLRKQIEIYKNSESSFPSGLSALVAKGYLPRIPEEPFGGTWTYVAATGVVTSSTEPDW